MSKPSSYTVSFTPSVSFFLLLSLDRKYQFDSFLFFTFLDPISANGAQVILSTIAGSMITVAGTVFSITIVTLTLASNQFGPRLLRNFMGSTINQVVLGSFISTFVYCLCLLGSVEPAGLENFVPGLSVNFALGLALANVTLLIFFIHHVAKSIQVETVIEKINSDLINNIHEYFPERSAKQEQQQGDNSELVGNGIAELQSVESDEYGYVQAINTDVIGRLASEYGVRLILEEKPGAYVMRGMPLASLDKNISIDDSFRTKVQTAFLLGPERTSEQDVEYSIHQLVEITVRALSPGVNDPFTALSCIDYLGGIITRVTNREFPAQYLFDDKNSIIVTLKPTTFSGIVCAAFDQIRQHSRSDAAVSIRLLEVFHTAIKLTNDAEQKEVLKRQADMVHRSAMEEIPEELDRKDINDRFVLIQEIMDADSEKVTK